MIACNACQLLATNLPVCHSCLLALSLWPFKCFLRSFFLVFVRLLFIALFCYLSTVILTLLPRWSKCRLYWFLQYFFGFGLLMLSWFFKWFEVQKRVKIRLNLVYLVASVRYLELMLSLSWSSWTSEVVLIFFHVDMLIILWNFKFFCFHTCEI